MTKMDLTGLKCPEPIMKIATKAKSIKKGEMVEIIADCQSFPDDIKAWCDRTGRTLLFCIDEGGKHKAQIQF